MRSIDPTLRIGGYAPGDYMCHCAICGDTFSGDKRAWHCKPCAARLRDEREANEAFKPEKSVP